MAKVKELSANYEEQHGYTSKSTPVCRGLLQLKSQYNFLLNELMCDQITEKIDNHTIKTKDCLVLTNSVENAKQLRQTIKSKLGEDSKMKIWTFTEFIQQFLSNNYPNWKLIRSKPTRKCEITSLAAQINVDNCNTHFKYAVQELSKLSYKKIKAQPSQHFFDNYGLSKKQCLKLKKLLHNSYYLTESKFCEIAPNLPEFESFMTNHRFVYFAKFHTLPEYKAKFLLKASSKSHLTITTHTDPKCENRLQKTEKYIEKYFKNTKVEISNDLDRTVTIPLTEVNQTVDLILRVFDNPQCNTAFLQLLRMLPNFDEKFITSLCEIIGEQNLCVYDFLTKYETSFNNEIRSQITPIINFLQQLNESLDYTRASSVVKKIVSFYKKLGLEATMHFPEQQLHALEIELRKAEQDSEIENIIRYYIANRKVSDETKPKTKDFKPTTTKTIVRKSPIPFENFRLELNPKIDCENKLLKSSSESSKSNGKETANLLINKKQLDLWEPSTILNVNGKVINSNLVINHSPITTSNPQSCFKQMNHLSFISPCASNNRLRDVRDIQIRKPSRKPRPLSWHAGTVAINAVKKIK